MPTPETTTLTDVPSAATVLGLHYVGLPILVTVTRKPTDRRPTQVRESVAVGTLQSVTTDYTVVGEADNFIRLRLKGGGAIAIYKGDSFEVQTR